MADPEKIEYWKKQFATHSDEQLLADKHQWIPSSDMHIAAVQLLHTRQQLAQTKALELENQHHQESMAQEKKLHGRTQFVAWLAAIASVVGILFQLFYPGSSSTISSPPAQSGPPAPTASPAASPSSLPPTATPKLATQPPAPPKP